MNSPENHISTAAPLRVAVAGAGKMGQEHIRAIRRLGAMARLVAVADPMASALDTARSVSGGADMYASFAEMLANARPDVVHVVTAPHQHEEMALAAIEAGAHVYVEKPFATSERAAKRIMTFAAARNRRVCAGHQLLFEDPARETRALVPTLGRICHIESYFSFRQVRRAGNGRIPLASDLQLLDILPHPVYLLLHFLEIAQPDARTELAGLTSGPAGTVHALMRRGGVTASLVVSLEARPVESYLRVVGSNGSVHADFVRGSVQRLIGPGSSGIDKAVAPYRLGRQLLTGTTSALARRVMRRQTSYAGLAQIFTSFYAAIRAGEESPLTPESLIDTVRFCDAIASVVQSSPTGAARRTASTAARVLVTGGTGMLGREVVAALVGSGVPTRVLSRRLPPEWERDGDVEYVAGDLGAMVPPEALTGIEVVVHCAAATAGGRDAHQRDSLDATERIMRAASASGVRVVHISSLAVLAERGSSAPVAEGHPLEQPSDGRGPYVWGKLESERLAGNLASELGVPLRVVRPGALTDARAFEPPGRLGKRLGNLFVAVGSRRERIGVADVRFAGRIIAWIARHFDEAPAMVNLLDPQLPSRGDLVDRLKRINPDLTVVWLPRALLVPLSFAALAAQRILRPGRPAINVAKAFASPAYDTSVVASVARQAESELAAVPALPDVSVCARV